MSKEACSFPGCYRKHHAKGYCITHYGQLYRGEKLHSISKQHVISPKAQRHIAALETGIEAVMQDINRATECYRLVVGLELRLHWRQVMKDLDDELARLQAELTTIQNLVSRERPRKS